MMVGVEGAAGMETMVGGFGVCAFFELGALLEDGDAGTGIGSGDMGVGRVTFKRDVGLVAVTPREVDLEGKRECLRVEPAKYYNPDY